jgi:hypothetical protein
MSEMQRGAASSHPTGSGWQSSRHAGCFHARVLAAVPALDDREAVSVEARLDVQIRVEHDTLETVAVQVSHVSEPAQGRCGALTSSCRNHPPR